MELYIIILVFLVGILSSILGGIAGGGAGLIIVPFLIFLGLPPKMAVATNKFGAIGSAIVTSYKFGKAKKIVFRHMIYFILITALGVLLGVNFLIRIDEGFFLRLVGIMILVMLPFIFFNKVGLKRKSVAKKYLVIGFLFYLLTAVYGGFFGAGGGILGTYVLVLFFGLTYLEANATLRIPWLISLILAVIIFSMYGLVNYFYGFVLFFGRIIGGYIGSHIAIKKGEGFVKIIFSLMVLGSAIKLIFF